MIPSMQQGTSTQLRLFDSLEFKSLRGPSLADLDISQFAKLSFGSRSEMALAILFRNYIPKWEAIQGETYQIPLGNHRYADFRINDTLFEYHPIVTQWHMRDKNAYHMFADAMKKVRDKHLKKNYR